MWIERRKWPDAPHYSSEGYVLGSDDVGVWLGARPGNVVYRGGERSHIGQYGVVWCVPHGGWFLAHFFLGHPQLDIYVDVAAPAVWSERGVHMVDLDFDVIVWNDGRPIELVDEDEFEQHRVELDYPDHLVKGARSAARELFARVQAGAPPFSMEAVEPWRARLDQLPE